MLANAPGEATGPPDSARNPGTRPETWPSMPIGTDTRRVYCSIGTTPGVLSFCRPPGAARHVPADAG
ncbi:MAG TPA: hypothetical protein VGR98_21055 [Streptosporangiaceae bacterium]|nr:hypothetical protein [Streptosporangiaceae bacterium]